MDYEISNKRQPAGTIAGSTAQRRSLRGFIRVPPELWKHLPRGAFVRYETNGDNPEFYRGGFVKGVSADGAAIAIEVGYSGPKKEWSIETSRIANLWKRYDRGINGIELHLIITSLAEKNEEIRLLNERIKRLEIDNPARGS